MVAPIILAIIVVVALVLVVLYNRLVSLRNHRKNALADIDVQLTNRFDLVDNLVATVKGYATHEKETLQGITEARTSFLNAGSADAKFEANNQLSGALKSLFAVAENYPDLKANQNFLQLQTELSDLENKIAAARRFFNSATREYNTAIQSFPSNLIAQHFGFTEESSYELENQAARTAPKVEF